MERGAWSGYVCTTWQDHRSSPLGDVTVLLSRSTDGGTTWSTPDKINKTPPWAYDTLAFNPQVQVDSSGRVAVTYYDMRANAKDKASGIRSTRSSGRSTPTMAASRFGDERELSVGPFDMHRAPYARGCFVGDYTGSASTAPPTRRCGCRRTRAATALTRTPRASADCGEMGGMSAGLETGTAPVRVGSRGTSRVTRRFTVRGA